jgi:phospholipase/carboxylesterase
MNMSRSVGALLCLVFAFGACEARSLPRDSRAASAPSSSPIAAAAPAKAREPFLAPGRDGWGRAAGLRYLERTLAGGDPARPLPLVIMIHGMGDAPRFDWFTGASAIKTPMRLIMPEAPTPYYDGFSWFPYDPAKPDPNALARGISSAADQLARAIEELRVRRATVGRPIITGFSQGAMLSYALALQHPELVAFSHPISGFLPEPSWPAQKPTGTRFPRIAAMHGDRDDVVPIAPARQLETHLRALGYEVTLREFAGVRHQITPDMEAFQVELLDSAARSESREGAKDREP